MTSGLDDATSSLAAHRAMTTSPVSLTIPALPEFFLVARMSARAVATCLDERFERVEDLRLLIDELCNLSAKGAGAGARMTLTYSWDDEYVEVRCTTSGVGEPDAAELASVDSTRELSEMILVALTESFGIDSGPNRRTVWFRQRRGGLASA